MVGIMLPGRSVFVFAVAHAERLNTPSSFMLVGGVSATSEMCLTGLENVGASLSHCGTAVTELDGREIWSLSAGGALTSLKSKQCLAVPSGAVAGARVALAPCDGPDASTACEIRAPATQLTRWQTKGTKPPPIPRSAFVCMFTPPNPSMELEASHADQIDTVSEGKSRMCLPG